MPSTEISRRQIFNVAWPIILANLSTPLLGLVDTAVIGNLGEASLLGAIALGAVIFSFIYWGFGFLRMGTTALVAQAIGADQPDDARDVFLRAALLGTGIGLVLMVLQTPIASGAFQMLDGSNAVEQAADRYFSIRIMGAPFSLALLAVMGYLLGLQATRTVLILNLILNGLNITLDLVFVLLLGWDVEGVALATVISELTTLAIGLLIILPRLRKPGAISLHKLASPGALTRMFSVNRDIMIRTLCLIFAFAWFTNQGASQGDIILAANAILMQFVSFAAFFLDGFAIAAESVVGIAVGSRNSARLNQSIRYVFEMGLITSVILSCLYWLLGADVVSLLTNVEPVRQATEVFLWWAIASPIVSVSCYLLDGIFIGATRTPEMRNAMIISLIAFLGLWWLAVPVFGNHGLWLALHGYFIARALSLSYYLPGLMRQQR
tara:strand:+ start:6695 stop:8005 length:1311 start_codon:yes stop_codon:yes gene_type:complete